MNKFDEIIATKFEQLNEVTGLMGSNTPTATPAQGTTPAPAPQGTTPAQADPNKPQEPAQNQNQNQNQNPEQALANVFKTLKFSDPNTAVTALNNAMKGAGNVPGIKEFFSGLAFDPQKGFVMAQQGQQAQPAQPAQANAAPALK